jgi:hypothetical protein
MKKNANRIGRAAEEAEVSAAEQVAGVDAMDGGYATRKGDPDAEWLSMTTGDPALYIKDAE